MNPNLLNGKQRGLKQKKTLNSSMLTRRELLKYSVCSGFAACLPGSLQLIGCKKQPRSTKPNVVLILIDTLRPDYLGFYGHNQETATFLAKLAKSSVVFTRAFATSSWTAPSTASLFTSLYPHQHGILEGLRANKNQTERINSDGEVKIHLNHLPSGLLTLPEYFKKMGYATFGMATNPNIDNEIGFSRGFDQFRMNPHAPVRNVYLQIKQWKELIEKSAPFFLYLHLNDVHLPYNIRKPYYKKPDNQQDDMQARYYSEIGYVDAYIKKIYTLLNLNDNTISMFVSDHGEEFMDHGDVGHSAKLYRELTQVLMFLYAPCLDLKPRYINVNVSLIDVMPTLIELVGSKSVQGLEGTSFVPLLKNNKHTQALKKTLYDRVLFSHRIVDAATSSGQCWSEEHPELQHWAAIHKHWNLIEWMDGSRAELFDHRNDLAEKQNVISENSKVALQLLASLKKFKEYSKKGKTEKIPVTIDKEMLKTLRSLGYAK